MLPSSMIKQEYVGADSSTVTVDDVFYNWKRCDFNSLKVTKLIHVFIKNKHSILATES